MKIDIARAWKDENYRQSLSAEELAQLPENPAGAFELSELELEAIHGAWGGDKGESQLNQVDINESRFRSRHFEAGNNQIVSAFVLCLFTTILAICVADNR